MNLIIVNPELDKCKNMDRFAAPGFLARGRWVAALRLVGVGFFIGGSIVLGLFVGRWLDNWWGTGLFWIVGVIIGICKDLITVAKSDIEKSGFLWLFCQGYIILTKVICFPDFNYIPSGYFFGFVICWQ